MDSRLSPTLIPVPEVLHGSRVLLRPLSLGDAPALLQAIDESRELLGRWICVPDRVRSLDDARVIIARDQAGWLLRERLSFGIFERGGGCLLGDVSLLHPNWELRAFAVGYWLRRSAQGRGYMREAVRLVTRLAFEGLGANRVEIRMDPRNVRSRAVAESCGYVLEGTLRRSRLDKDGKPADDHVFSLVTDDYAGLDWRNHSLSDVR